MIADAQCVLSASVHVPLLLFLLLLPLLLPPPPPPPLSLLSLLLLLLSAPDFGSRGIWLVPRHADRLRLRAAELRDRL